MSVEFLVCLSTYSVHNRTSPTLLYHPLHLLRQRYFVRTAEAPSVPLLRTAAGVPSVLPPVHDSWRRLYPSCGLRLGAVSVHFELKSRFCACVLQNVVTNKLEGGDRQKAMKRLRVPPLGEQVRASVRACVRRC